MKGKLSPKMGTTLLLALLFCGAGGTVPSIAQPGDTKASPAAAPTPVGKAAAAATPAAAPAAVGKSAPAFTLSDTAGNKHSLSDAANKIVVLEWTNYDCPFCCKQYNTGDMQKLQKTYTAKGVVWFSICSSAEGRQGNYPASKIIELMKQKNAVPTAYLFDPDGAVGHAYGATSTPHMFVINQKGIIVYAGAMDDNPSADISDKAGTNYVQKALDETLANKPISVSSTKSYGCSVKYKS